MMRSTERSNICKRLWILSFAKDMSKNIGKIISKSLSGKYSQELLDHAKNIQQMRLKLLQKEQFKNDGSNW